MIERLQFGLTVAATLGSGLMAGLFFTFSTFGMAALGRIAPASGIAAMQSINITILNPLFLSIFMGTALASVALAAAAVCGWSRPGAALLLAGSLLYLAAIAVTGIVNVPMNDALAAVDPASAEGAVLWQRYLADWTSWNHVRTVACLAATAGFILSLCAA